MDSVIEVSLVSLRATDDDSILSLLLDADIIVQSTLVLLLLMSIACWGIIVMKGLRLRSATAQSRSFLEVFWNARRLDEVYNDLDRYGFSPVAALFRSGYQELAKVTKSGGKRDEAADNLTRTLRRTQMAESDQLERYLIFLGTTGSTAPFIGLFGTVWGILRAFQKLGNAEQASIQVVGPDISHALVATAVGLVAAIPAVMAFNYFNARIRALNTEMEIFSSDFVNYVKRQLKS